MKMTKLKRDERVCPFCAETIKASAIRCRFCQSDVTPLLPLSPVRCGRILSLDADVIRQYDEEASDSPGRFDRPGFFVSVSGRSREADATTLAHIEPGAFGRSEQSPSFHPRP